MPSINSNALRALDWICQAAGTLNFNCEIEIQANGVRLNFTDDLVVVARLNVSVPTIKFIATQFDAVPRHLVPEFCEIIAMLNVSMSVGYFALEVETMEFRFYYDMPYEFGGDLKSAVCSALDIVVSNFRQIQPIAKMISDNALSMEKAIEMLKRPHCDDAEAALSEVCKIIKEMTDERDVVHIETDRKQIIVTQHDEAGTATRKTTIRVDENSRTLHVLSVLPVSKLELARLVRHTKWKFSSAKVDECRKQLIVSGTVKFGRRVQQQPFSDLLKEHIKSTKYIPNANMCQA